MSESLENPPNIYEQVKARFQFYLSKDTNLSHVLDSISNGSKLPELTCSHRQLTAIYFRILRPNQPLPSCITLPPPSSPFPLSTPSSTQLELSPDKFLLQPRSPSTSSECSTRDSSTEILVTPHFANQEESFSVVIPNSKETPTKKNLEHRLYLDSVFIPKYSTRTRKRETILVSTSSPSKRKARKILTTARTQRNLTQIFERTQTKGGKVMYCVCWDDGTMSWESPADLTQHLPLLEKFEHLSFQRAESWRGKIISSRTSSKQRNSIPITYQMDPSIQSFH
ncbi:hypothetical protein K7432_014805 [Basidiobolus ranarum]|uniref:Chromo domain-containing protein n=1 Tax=Basidiobolus ranarum TaxID=34480 RepID=A0ABR2WH20_9FUNG